LLGLDRAERLNDGRGRLERNRVLAALGPALIESGRRYDLVARLDDDRFLVVLPETGGRAAVEVADRLRTSAQAAVADVTQAELGLSIGVGEWNVGDSVTDFLASANEALREAKRNGGGRVVADISPQRRFDGLVELARDVVRGRPPAGQDTSPKPSSTDRGKESARPTDP
jgi:diguanylate cyclase